jgi:hypothetical protein
MPLTLSEAMQKSLLGSVYLYEHVHVHGYGLGMRTGATNTVQHI